MLVSATPAAPHVPGAPVEPAHARTAGYSALARLAQRQGGCGAVIAMTCAALRQYAPLGTDARRVAASLHASGITSLSAEGLREAVMRKALGPTGLLAGAGRVAAAMQAR